MKKLIIICSVLPLFIFNLYSQQFTLEWTSPEVVTYIGDIDGDNIGEFMGASGDSFLTNIYDGASHTIKYSFGPLGWPGTILRPEIYLPFMDLNNNGVKDFFVEYDYLSLSIIDPSTNELIFEHNNALGTQFLAVDDFDNDGIIEIAILESLPNGGTTLIYSTGASSTNISDTKKFPKFKLLQNYPNPFNPETTIEYEIKNTAKVSIEIYNSLGQRVKTLINNIQSPNTYSITWDGKDSKGVIVGSGLYYYQIKVGDEISTKKMILLK